MDLKGFINDEDLYRALCRAASKNDRTPLGEARHIIARELNQAIEHEKEVADKRREEEITRQLKEQRLRRAEERVRLEKERNERAKLRAVERSKMEAEHVSIQRQKEARRQERLQLAKQKADQAERYRGVTYERGYFFANVVDPQTGITSRVGKGKPTAEEAALERDDAMRGIIPDRELNFPHLLPPAARAVESIGATIPEGLGPFDLAIKAEENARDKERRDALIAAGVNLIEEGEVIAVKKKRGRKVKS